MAKKLIQTHITQEQHDKLSTIGIRAGGASNADMLRIAVTDFIAGFEEKHGEIKIEEHISLT